MCSVSGRALLEEVHFIFLRRKARLEMWLLGPVYILVIMAPGTEGLETLLRELGQVRIIKYFSIHSYKMYSCLERR